ncbi:hypothetical protein E2C01_008753 [Portunus trituberculatus]|uniref:Uncharacterized protein n=1 Tax=Portunus trituberculatus TaxID=210409 RepID=A0A5B7D1M5_PORTR|nr:hypothetical protein [Portunus trituberculatus]
MLSLFLCTYDTNTPPPPITLPPCYVSDFLTNPFLPLLLLTIRLQAGKSVVARGDKHEKQGVGTDLEGEALSLGYEEGGAGKVCGGSERGQQEAGGEADRQTHKQHEGLAWYGRGQAQKHEHAHGRQEERPRQIGKEGPGSLREHHQQQHEDADCRQGEGRGQQRPHATQNTHGGAVDGEGDTDTQQDVQVGAALSLVIRLEQLLHILVHKGPVETLRQDARHATLLQSKFFHANNTHGRRDVIKTIGIHLARLHPVSAAYTAAAAAALVRVGRGGGVWGEALRLSLAGFGGRRPGTGGALGDPEGVRRPGGINTALAGRVLEALILVGLSLFLREAGVILALEGLLHAFAPSEALPGHHEARAQLGRLGIVTSLTHLPLHLVLRDEFAVTVVFHGAHCRSPGITPATPGRGGVHGVTSCPWLGAAAW